MKRGDPLWKTLDNKINYPEGSVPFWQLINPFTLGLTRDEKSALGDMLTLGNFSMNVKVKTTPSGRRYFMPNKEESLGIQLRRSRVQIYKAIPREIRERLPKEVNDKYDQKRKQFSVKSAMYLFSQDEKELSEIYSLVKETPELKQFIKTIREKKKPVEIIQRQRIYPFRKKLYHHLPEKIREKVPEDIAKRYSAKQQ